MSLPLADTNWTVGGNVNGQASHKNHCCNLCQVYGPMQCIGTYHTKTTHTSTTNKQKGHTKRLIK